MAAVLTQSMRRAVDRLGSGRVVSRTPRGARQDVVHDWLAVWDDATLAFVDASASTGGGAGALAATVRNLVESPPVAVVVHDPDAGVEFQFRGTARVLLSGPTFDRVRAFYSARGLHATFEHVVFVDVAECISGEAGSGQ